MHAAGCNAYFDSFSGLVPCRVTRVWTEPLAPWLPENQIQRAELVVRKDHGPYKEGYEFETITRNVIPPENVNRSGMHIRISSARWEDTKTA